jgi:hypothetical protein
MFESDGIYELDPLKASSTLAELQKKILQKLMRINQNHSNKLDP